MAGLDEISRNIGGAYGAYTFGQQNELERQKSSEEVSKLRELIQGLQQERQFAAQKMPGLLEHQNLLNQGLSADLPGRVAEAGGKQLTLRKNLATEGSDISTALSTNQATVSNNANTINKNQVDTLQRGQALLQQLATQSASLPPALRMGYIRSSMEKAGANLGGESGQQLLGALSSTSPEQIPQVMGQLSEALGKQLASMNPSYLGTVETARISGDKAIKVANINAGASKYVADKNFEAKQVAAKAKAKASDLVASVKSGKVTPANALAAARFEAVSADTEEEKQYWNTISAELQTVINNSPQGQGQGGKVDTGQLGGLPIRPTPNPYSGPKVGAIQDGFRFKGGDPSKESSWEKL